MTYNTKIIREQGGSVLRVASGGSLNIDSGGEIDISGDLKLGNTVDIQDGASLTLAAGGVLSFGGITRIHFAASAAAPSGLPYSGSPGDIFLRIDGANSAAYMNTSDGTAGSVWTIFSELAG